jgi:hypothetical protein
LRADRGLHRRLPVREFPDPYGHAPTYTDSCRTGYVCTCAGAPGCPTNDPNAGQVVGALLGTSELWDEPQTCEAAVAVVHWTAFTRYGCTGLVLGSTSLPSPNFSSK